MIKGVLFRHRLPSVHHIPRKDHSRSRLRLVYFGSDQYSLIHLRALAEQTRGTTPYEIQHVVTANDTTPVAQYCTQVGLSCSTWPRHPSNCADALISHISEWQNDSHSRTPSNKEPRSGILGLVISFGRFLPTSLIAAFGRGCVNIHPSLLPRWRGSSPLLHTLLAGDEVSGITVIQLPTNEHTFDTGPVLHQEAVRLDLSRPLTTTQLGQYLSSYSIEAMFKIIEQAWNGKFHHVVPQSVLTDRFGLHPSNAPRPTEPMGYVNWTSQTASDVVRWWYALHETSISLSTSMSISSPKYPASEACVRFLGQSPVTVLNKFESAEPEAVCENHPSSYIREQCALHEASNLLHLIPYSFPFGSLIYLRSQHHTNHPLLPFAFVACPADNPHPCHPHSWLAVPSVQIRMPGSNQFRPLTALDLYNGYLRESESRELSKLYCLPHGFHLFHGFHSLSHSNPLFSLSEYKQPMRNPALVSIVHNFFKTNLQVSTPSLADNNSRPVAVS